MTVRYTLHGSQVAEIRLENTVANVLNMDVVSDLAGAIAAAIRESKAAVLFGGEKFFCNGLDLQWAIALDRTSLRHMFLALSDLVLQILEAPLPIVGAMKGHAIGAGKTLLVATDFRIGASGRVLFGMPEVKLGVPNPYFAEMLLRFLTSEAIASNLIYTGELITAEQAATFGLINAIHDSADVENAALDKAAALGDLPRLAFAHSKRQRSLILCREIRANVGCMIENLLDAWFGPEAQAILRATAGRLKK